MMPGNRFSPACSFRTRFSRTSCLTGRMRAAECLRRSPRVWIESAIERFYPNWRATSCPPLPARHSGWSGRPRRALRVQSDVHRPVPHPFFSSTRALLFAHRGGSALAPENTLAGFDNGLALGVDGLELDVHLSRDGIVVVHHDRRLERTTNLAGPIADRTAEELSRADAGY